ncbi:MAG: DUF362 domain-containing protein [Deltaproteobacteria bacterium]|nr:MAG: DUF362 domain-containing protein [Deltaproteobacteria bacterium]
MSGRCRSRREFLRDAGCAVGAAVLGAGFPFPGFAASGKGVDVSIASAGDPAECARRAVALLGGMKAFVSRGDVVVLKPNIGWDRTPEQAANTHPEFVVAVAEMCLAAGAKSVRVFDRTCNEPRRCYASSGIQAAVERFAKKARAEDALRVYHAEDRKFVRTAIPGALVLKEWELHRDALEADRIVNLPIAKHHTLASATLGIKNMMGIMGGNRGQIHNRLSECLVDIHRRVPVHLTVIDAGRVLMRNGPSGGNLADVKVFGKAIASRDVVAADVVAAERIFGFSVQDVPHVRKALEAGLGISSIAQIRRIEG